MRFVPKSSLCVFTILYAFSVKFFPSEVSKVFNVQEKCARSKVSPLDCLDSAFV